MDLIQIRIHKAVTVPATGTTYQYRTEWRFIHKITYPQSETIFKNVGRKGVGLEIETDAQFAKWLVDNFGHGRYQAFIFKKGVSGWTFFNFNCTKSNRFFQVKREPTLEEREKEENVREYKKKKRSLERAESESEREEIKEEMEELAEDIDVGDILEEGQKRNSIKIKPFRNTPPLYKEHGYEEYGDLIKLKEKGVDNKIW
jgi:hypothetical protein